MGEVGSCTDRLRVIAIIIPALSEGFLCHLKARQSWLRGAPTPNHPHQLLPKQENCYSAESLPGFICFKGRFMMLLHFWCWFLLTVQLIEWGPLINNPNGYTKISYSLTELRKPLVYLELKMPKSHWRTDLVCSYSHLLLQTNKCSKSEILPSNTPKLFRNLCLFQSERDEVERSQSITTPKRERDGTGAPEELKIRI